MQNRQRGKKVLAKELPKGYNSTVGRSVRQQEGVNQLPDYKNVTGGLYDDHGTWTVRARVTNRMTGKTVQRSKSTGFKVKDNTKRKATAAMKEIMAKWEEEANALLEPEKPKDPVFMDLVDEWFEMKKPLLKPTTISNYRRDIEVHLRPYFGDVLLSEVTHSYLQEFYNFKALTLKRASILSIHKITAQVINRAVLDDLILKNPCKGLEFQKSTKYDRYVYSETERDAFLREAKSEGEPYFAFALLTSVYGLRRSEAFGLRWCDINLDMMYMHIRNTVVYIRGEYIEAETTKTDSSNRKIWFDSKTKDYFLRLKGLQECASVDIDKVVANLNGRQVTTNAIAYHIHKIMTRAGLKRIRIHDLRHTAATILARSATPKQVQDFLGHSDISMTMNIYTHLLDEDQKQIASLVGRATGNVDFCSE